MARSHLPAVIGFKPVFYTENPTAIKTSPELPLLRKLYISTFTTLSNLSPAYFNKKFNLELNHPKTDWIFVLNSNKIIGFVTIEELNESGSLFLRQGSIPPHLLEKPLVEKLMEFISASYPECIECNLLLREEYLKNFKFLTTLGFKPSLFSYKGFNPKIYQGYTFKRDQKS